MTTDTCEVLELGIQSMDEEHRELLRLLDAFIRCVKEGGPPGRAHEIVNAAIECANAHFEHEEELAAQADYPQLEEEKFQHRKLRLQFTTLIGDTVTSNNSDPITREHLKDMRTLLEEHISGPDKDLADFLKAVGQT